MSETKGRRGPARGTATVKCTVMLDPDLHEWGIEQVGGLSETVRLALRAWRRMTHARPVAETGTEEFYSSKSFSRLPEKHQRTLMKLLSLLSSLDDAEDYSLETNVYFGSDDSNRVNFVENGQPFSSSLAETNQQGHEDGDMKRHSDAEG